MVRNKHVTRKKVVRKPQDEKWILENVENAEKDGYLRSSTWSLGGTSGGYSSDELTRVDPETPPVAFFEFDDLLLKICPEISFLKYKKLYNDCVTTETESHGDYYGGSTTRANFKCDLKKLYSLLTGLGIVQES
jgi:hypothetical protein